MRPSSQKTRSALTALAAIIPLSSAVFAQEVQGELYGAVYTMSNAANGNAILVFHQTQTGALSQAGSFATRGLGTGAGLGNAGGVVLSQDQHWLFAVNAGSNEVSVFAVDDHGGLTLASKTASGGSNPISITVDDELVYVLNSSSNSIAGFSLAQGGRLVAIPGSIRSLGGTANAPAEIAFTPDGRNLIITEKATNQLAVFDVDNHGLASAPTQIVPSPAPTPFGFAFSNRKTLLVSDAGGGTNGSSITSYRLKRHVLPAIVGGPIPTHQSAACWVAVTPDGRYVYTSNAASQSISGFAVSPMGELSPLAANGVTGSTAGAGNPIDSVISSDGQFLYVLDSGKDSISTFRIANDGSLTQVATLPGLPASADGLAFR